MLEQLFMKRWVRTHRTPPLNPLMCCVQFYVSSKVGNYLVASGAKTSIKCAHTTLWDISLDVYI